MNYTEEMTKTKAQLFPLLSHSFSRFTKKKRDGKITELRQRKEISPMDSNITHLNNAVLKFLAPLTPKETYKTIVDEAIKLVYGDEGMVMLPHQGALRTVYGSSEETSKKQPRKRGFAYRAFTKREAFVIHQKDFEDFDPLTAATGVRSIIFIPMSYKKQSLGVLVVRSHKKDEEFSEKQLELLKLFGTFASMAIRKTQLYDETKRSLEVRDLFISTAAHELRTPLTTINGYMQLLKGKVTKENFPYYRWFEELSWEVLRLSLLVNELLEINRIKTGQFQYAWKECSLHEIMKRAISNFSFAFPNHTLILEDNINATSDIIIADFDKILQVINNILQNAGKYSSEKSTVTIGLKSRSPWYIIEVEDHGQGIPKDDLARIFEEFHKGKDRNEEGMGVGLYLAKSIIKQHHGTIEVFSKLHKGTTVEIKLPKRKI